MLRADLRHSWFMTFLFAGMLAMNLLEWPFVNDLILGLFAAMCLSHAFEVGSDLRQRRIHDIE